MSAIAGEHTPTAPTGLLTRARLKWLAYATLGGLIAFVGARYGYEYWSVGRFIESTDDAYAGGNVTPISPHVAGFVAEILVGDNEYVRAGQPLIRLDDRDFRAAADRAAAIVEARKATLDSLERKLTLQQTAIRQAKADLDAKNAQAAFAKEDDQRYRDLAQTAAGSRQNAERASSLNLAAEASVISSEAGLDAAKQQLTVLDAEIAVAKADVTQAEADLHTADLNLGYTEIRSPIDGYVGNRAAQVGAYAPAAPISSRSSRRMTSGWTPTSRKASSSIWRRDKQRQSSPMCCRTTSFAAMCSRWRPRRAPSSA